MQALAGKFADRSNRAPLPGGNESAFRYGPDRQRFERVDGVTGQGQGKGGGGGSTTRTVLYVSKAYERHVLPGQDDELVHYIRAAGVVAIYTEVDDGQSGTNRTRYLHLDHLGSVETITDESGNITEELSYDSFGQRRDEATWLPAASYIAGQETDRGFTGHEHIDDAGLIHMGGRVYDPVLGRFLSADPILQKVDDLQALNRYSYVRNNPLSYTDPSGFFFKKLFKSIANAFKAIVTNPRLLIATAILIAAPYALPFNAIINGAIAGFASGFIATGTVKGGLIGAFTGAAFGALHGIEVTGGLFSGLGAFKVAAHGTVGGVSARLQGGKFATGFFSAAFTQAVSIRYGATLDKMNRVAQAAIAAAIGGTAAAIAGGDPAMGALMGVYSRLLNDSASLLEEYKGKELRLDELPEGESYARCTYEPCYYFPTGNERNAQIVGWIPGPDMMETGYYYYPFGDAQPLVGRVLRGVARDPAFGGLGIFLENTKNYYQDVYTSRIPIESYEKEFSYVYPRGGRVRFKRWELRTRQGSPVRSANPYRRIELGPRFSPF